MLAAVKSFQLLPFVDSLVSLATAFALGTLIGAERQYRQRTAGLRTNVLVAVGAAAFVDIGMRLNGNASAAHVMAYVVSGVGFLGAGVIFKEGINVRGLNTAATLWGSAAVGATAGGDFIAEAVMIAFFVILANTALRPLVKAINRQPLDAETSELTYELHIIVEATEAAAVRQAVTESLKRHRHSVATVSTEDWSETAVELTLELSAPQADPRELDKVLTQTRGMAGVKSASWLARTGDAA